MFHGKVKLKGTRNVAFLSEVQEKKTILIFKKLSIVTCFTHIRNLKKTYRDKVDFLILLN